jgi:uncharacterized protein YgbK (DUF1537 family)
MKTSKASLPINGSQQSAPDSGGITLLADDLTGACDAAVAFLAAGCEARVWLGCDAVSASDEAVQAFNTESRALPAEQAAAVVTRAATAWNSTRRRFVFKKVDSAGRGPIAAELLALKRVLLPRFVVLAAAFPATGRIVQNGVLRTTDATGSYALPPLADPFPAEAHERIAHIGHPNEIAKALGAGKSIFLCDAATQDDLAALVRATRGQDCLYAGSAGLARALAGAAGIIASQRPHPHAERLLILAGTQHPLTELQLANLQPGSASVHVERLLWDARDRARIFTAFSSIAPDALLLTGGDTALAALRTLGADSILLGGESAPGIPWGRVHGGMADGRIVITKSGGFGSANILQQIAEKLKGAR